MHKQDVVPEKDSLRRAVQWLSETGPWTMQRIDQAALRFDLTPLDQDFLIRLFNEDRKKKPS